MGLTGLSVWHVQRSCQCKLQTSVFFPLLFLLQMTLTTIRGFFCYFSLFVWSNLYFSFLCHPCSCLLWFVLLLTPRRETKTFECMQMTASLQNQHGRIEVSFCMNLYMNSGLSLVIGSIYVWTSVSFCTCMLHFCHARVIHVKVLRSGIISSVYLPNIAVQPSSFWHIS